MVLQATKKLQDFLGIKVISVPENIDSFSCWHANIFLLNRKKCLLITHNESLYTIFIYGVTKKDIPTLFEKIKKRISEQLRRDEFTLPQIANILKTLESIEFAKTSDRSVTGNMNNMVQAIEIHSIYDDTTDEYLLANACNETPYKRGKFYFPKKILRGLMKERLS